MVHLQLPQHLKSAACGANVTRLNRDVQQVLVRVIFLGGITAEPWRRDQVNRASRPDSLGKGIFLGKRLVGKCDSDTATRRASYLDGPEMPLCWRTRTHVFPSLRPSACR